MRTHQEGRDLATQKESSHQKLTPLDVNLELGGSRTVRKKINFCCLKHLACGILLQQPELTDTLEKQKNNHSVCLEYWFSFHNK